MSDSEPISVVLAAGKGTRMQSELPKVLVPACGRPLIDYVLDALDAAGIKRHIVVVGYCADQVKNHLSQRSGIEFVEQTEQLGTGHAVMVCRDKLVDHRGPVAVVTGDSPMLQASSIQALLDRYQEGQLAGLLGTLLKSDPTGLGRIVRNQQGEFTGIVEEKDASEAQRAIKEVNMSTYVFDTARLLESFDKLTNDNRQKEYYITDCPAILKELGYAVDALPVLKPCEALGVNNLDELAAVEVELQRIGQS